MTMKAFPSLSLLLRILVAAAVVVLGKCQHQNNNEDSSSPSFRVAGYLPDYRFSINLNATAPFLTDLMLFSVSPQPLGSDNVMVTGCCLNNHQFEVARRARASKTEKAVSGGGGGGAGSSSSSSLNLWLTVGGGGRSEHFHKHPVKLATAIKDLAVKQKLDGIDLDCEDFPTQNDYQRYMRWVNSTAVPMWKKHGLQVSIALHAGQFMFPDLYKAVDRVNLMTYDLPSGGPSTGGHKKYHADVHLVRGAVKKLMASGCPANKIMLGIPAYARHEDYFGNTKSYAELVDEMEKDKSTGIQSIDDFGSWNGYQAESPQAVRTKVAFARALGLAGVFFWELGQDKQHLMAPGGLLLEAAATGKTYKPVTVTASVSEEL